MLAWVSCRNVRSNVKDFKDLAMSINLLLLVFPSANFKNSARKVRGSTIKLSKISANQRASWWQAVSLHRFHWTPMICLTSNRRWRLYAASWIWLSLKRYGNGHGKDLWAPGFAMKYVPFAKRSMTGNLNTDSCARSYPWMRFKEIYKCR